MSALAAQPHTAAIDAALAKGAWWRDLFDALGDAGMTRVRALDRNSPAGLRRVVEDFERFARAVRLAVVAAMRLDGFLIGLTGLRRLTPAQLAAARASAKAKADADAAARAAARDRAKARRAARADDIRREVIEIIEREKPEPRDRDPLVEALDRRLRVDPALVALDDLPLREAVIRICEDLGITPDWRRWEARDWRFVDAPAAAAAAARTPSLVPPPPKQHHALAKPEPPPPNVAPSQALAQVSRRLPRRVDTALPLVLQSGPFAPPWSPPRPG